jgi:hypothetical protein
MFKNLRKVAGAAILIAFCCGLITCHVDLGSGSTQSPDSSKENASQDEATSQDEAASQGDAE